MELRSLASGSSGNAYLVREGKSAILIDAGLSARRLEVMLRAEGLQPGQLNGIVLTHEHSDHVRGAAGVAKRYGAPIFASAGTYRAFRDSPTFEWRQLRADVPMGVGALDVVPVTVPHDAAEPFIYRIQSEHGALAIATDFGCPTDVLEEALRDLDMLVLEANHDEDWLWRGGYPWSLKKRVAGERGHISNETAAGILTRLGSRAPRTVWLAHLSKHNNAPEHALHVVSTATRRAGLTHLDLQVAERDRPSLQWSTSSLTRQLALQF